MSQYKEYKDDYKTGLLGFPSVNTSEEGKDGNYHQNWAKGIYSHWYNGKAAIPRANQDDFDLLRMYGAGNQPMSQYFKPDQDVSGSSSSTVDSSSANSLNWDRKGKSNLDQSIISIAPRVKSMIKAYLSNIKEDVVIDTIDPKSGAEKEDKKWRTFLYAQEKDFIESFRAKAGMKNDPVEFMPETLNELEMYEQAGGFKLSHAADMERLIKYSLELSGYEGELEEELVDDLMDVGICATRKKLDPEDLKFKDHYVDVKYLVVEHSLHNDFRDVTWIGHTEFYTIAKLRQMIPEADESAFSDMAYAHSAKHGNPGDFSKYNTLNDAGSWQYDSFLIPVFEAEWLDTECEEAVFYDNPRGKTSKLPVTDETVSDKRGRYVKSNLTKWRQCSWVVGTEHVFDWGIVNMQDRPAHNKAISNYNIMGLSDSSLMAQLKPVLDDMQISWLRFQDARSNAAKNGYAINVAKLKAISSGGENYDIASLLRLWKERGLLLYQDGLHGKYEGGKTLPIDKLPATILDELQEFVGTWDHALKRMEDLTGINPLILGAAPDPEAPVGTQKLSVASSANAIKPLGMAINGIKRKSAESFMRRFVLACKARKDIVQSYEGVIGKTAIERLVNAGRSAVDYGMFFHVRPTETEKAALMESVNISLQSSREGRPGIDLQTKMFIEEQLYAGVNLKWLRFYVGYKERQIYKQDQEAKEKMINLQADRNDRSAQIAAQGDMRNSQMKLQGEAALTDKQAKSEVIKELVRKDDEIARQVASRMGFIGNPNNQLQGQNQGVQPLSPPNGM